MPATDSRGRPVISLKKGELFVADAAYMLDHTPRYILALIADGTLDGRRNEAHPDRRRRHWIVKEASVRDYALKTRRIIRELTEREKTPTLNENLGEYLTTNFGAALAAAGVLQIDGNTSVLGHVWVRYIRKRKWLAKFPRAVGNQEPLLGRRKFHIEVSADGIVEVTYKPGAEEKPATVRSTFARLVKNALATVDRHQKSVVATKRIRYRLRQ